MEEFFLQLAWVRTEVFVVRHGLAEARGDTVLLQESYILVYKLVVIGLIAVEYMRVGRTSGNAYSM